eukprot:CAMPEP_0176147766 /NCGR_PEP_ID=MMETSP0120_2-20121206/75333_1 /TAXON_ID=160619 /ORGANISM="Kryptoperidinium foliaceum, Strain CCMP 1326" /LENGTH=59 /DNA_ID=CAMNT_0017484399 /DNA_START=113 /DNA_END=292 /DNA_ORIENTATION=-
MVPGNCRMTAAKLRETLTKISSQKAKSSASKVSRMKGVSRFDLSGLTYKKVNAAKTSSM